MMKLTMKQQRFCDEYLIDLDAKNAAIRAGYSEKTAHSIGHENLNKPELKEYIGQRLAEKNDELIAKQDEVMKYLTKVMRREEQEYTVVTLSEEESTYVPDANGTMRKQTIKKEVPEIVGIPSKLSDANKAAELLGKRYVMWVDKTQVDATQQVVIQNDIDD